MVINLALDYIIHNMYAEFCKINTQTIGQISIQDRMFTNYTHELVSCISLNNTTFEKYLQKIHPQELLITKGTL